jgi:CheY-like chemotaxis protein
MEHNAITILLADDDIDDCVLFEDALTELSIVTALATVTDGEQLMRKLSEDWLPDLLFLDLNMPRKNGFECLKDLKANDKTRSVPVIIISTSFNLEVVKLLYETGARCYIRKPDEFEILKALINKAIQLRNRKDTISFNEFVLNS